MYQSGTGKKKIPIAFEAANAAKAHRAQAERLDDMAHKGSGKTPSEIKAWHEKQLIFELRGKAEEQERSKKQLLEQRKKLVDDHIASIRRSEKQLLELEIQLSNFKMMSAIQNIY